MPKLVWDQEGEKLWETGVDKGVIYKKDETGAYTVSEAWNGLTNVEESPSGGEPTALWADNQKYGEIMSTEEFGGTIEAYMYPDGFNECNGAKEIAPGVFVAQQTRNPFGFTYRSLIGNDTEGENHGYKIHIVYNAKVKPSSVSRSTVNESPEAGTMSWEFSTTPVPVPDAKPTAHLTFDSTKVAKEKMEALEAMLYGSESGEPKLPMPEEIITLMGDSAAG
jgi:hypothetical protein